MQGSLAGEHDVAAGARLKTVSVALQAGGARELEGTVVVVGEKLGVILDALFGYPFDPFGDRPVFLGPCTPGDLSVGNVADQSVAKAVLPLPRHGRGLAGSDELPSSELMQRRVERGFARADGLERIRPEVPTDDRSVLEQGLEGGGERIEAGCDDGMDRAGQFEVTR